MFHYVVDTAGERIHIAGFHGREHADAKLVSAELTVSVGVHNAVFAQCRHHLGCIDAIVDIDGDHGVGARVPVVYERGGVIGLLRPLVQQGRRPCAAGRSPGEPTVVVEPTNLVFQHDQRCHCRRVERLILAGILDGRSQGKERRNPAACARKIHAFGDAVGAFDCSGGEYGNP